MTDLAHNVEFLKAAFKGYDLNSDGRVTVKEFRRIMIRTGEIGQRERQRERQRDSYIFLGKMSDGDIEKMIEKADVDNDG